MVIQVYENKKMKISPKNRKISTSIVPVMFDIKEKVNFKNKKNHRQSIIISGFKIYDYINHQKIFKHNKKRTENHKYIG